MLRLVHIQRSSDSPADDPRYDLFDAGRHGEESGIAASSPLSRKDVREWLAREGLTRAAIERALEELEQTGAVELELFPRVGPRIVRAWFDTVLNPLLQSLELERGLVAKQNWTFAFRTATLELIRPVHRHLEPKARENLDQILELNAGLAGSIESHDNAVERLQSTVVALHRALATNREFIQMCDALLAAEKLRELGVESVREIFGAYPPSDRYELVAQQVVNNSGEEPSYYSTAKFWNRNRDVLLRSLTFPGVAEHHAATIQMGRHLADAGTALVRQLKDLRLELSLREDVPYAVGDRGKATV